MLTFKEITDIRNNTHAVENESYEDLKKIVLLSSNSKIYDDNDVGYYDNKTRWRNKKFLETISQIYYTPSYEQLCSRDEEFLSVIRTLDFFLLIGQWLHWCLWCTMGNLILII